MKHQYVTPFGGTSPDLALYQVGIRKEAIELNTSLDPSLDRVRVSILGRARLRPILFDRFYEIVALDERHPDAVARSPRGEVVFPEADEVLRQADPPQEGDDVVLNNVLSVRFGAITDPEVFAKVLQEILRRGLRRDERNS
ncbi:MAG TPA: hypothetical protein VJ326_04590 [Thermoplasmata archaeon]|nr:hypothetical protein [Thermoplasmata archaeon]